MRTRVAAIGAAVALAIGGLAACSNGQDVVRSGAASANEGVPLDALQRASAKTTDAGTAKVQMTFDASGVPGLGTTAFTADGAIDKNRSSFSVDLSKLASSLPDVAQAGIGAALGDGKVQVVTDGGDVYVKLGGLATFLGATSSAQWIKLSADSPAASVVGAPLGNGTEILKLLDQAGNVTTVGHEQVRGVDTTHYQGSLDIASALAAASADERAKAQSELGKVGIDPSAAKVPVDVWVDGDDLVRRVQIGVEGVKTTDPSASGDVGGTFTMELYDFGQPVDITVPPADQVFQVDPSVLGGLAHLGS